MEELNKKLADSEYSIHLPAFTDSLDACFKWLVPKIEKRFELTVTFHRCHGSIWSCLLTTYRGDIAVEPAQHTNPALALCKAIEKLIDEANKDG